MMGFEETLIACAALGLGGLVGDWLLGWYKRRCNIEDRREQVLQYRQQWLLTGQEYDYEDD